jgi:succinyl-CoA synthetase beta subunit
MVKFIDALYKAYIGSDASMFEINPVLKTSDDKILAVDAKVNIDAHIQTARDILEETRSC